MVATKSKMLPLGTKAPYFELLDTRTKEWVSFSDKTKRSGYLMAFICNHCPYVIHLKSHLPILFNELLGKNLSVFAISSNDANKYPADSPEKMSDLARELDFKFPYLYDESQETAKSYRAACTPDFFLFDENKELFYRGQYDESRPSNQSKVSGKDLTNAIELMLNGKPPPPEQIPSLGCNIKWK